MDLLERLNQLRPKWQFPDDIKRNGIACEICSDHTKDDSTPVWSGREIYENGKQGVIWAGLRATGQQDVFTTLATQRKKMNATTHWHIAQRAKEEIPLLFKITTTLQETIDVQRFNFLEQTWRGDDDESRKNDLILLHRQVLWPNLLGETDEKKTSLVYCHKVGALVFGIWAFHACGEGWVSTIEKAASPDEVNRLIWPASIVLLQIAASDIVELRMLRRDLTFLAANCLREKTAVIHEQELDKKIQGGEIESQLEKAERIYSRCNAAVGRIFHYECAFSILLAEILGKEPAEYFAEKLVHIEKLGRLFAAWHHVARSEVRNPCAIHSQFKDELETTNEFFDGENQWRLDEWSDSYWVQYVLPVISKGNLFEEQDPNLAAVKRMFFLDRTPAWLNTTPEN